MPETIPLDHDPSVAENNGIARRIEKLGLKEILDDTAMRREFFSHVNDQEYKRMLGYVNSVTKGDRVPDYDYKDGQMMLEPTPTLEFKEKLMTKTFDTVREILDDGSLADEDALELAGLTMAGAIYMTHPYEDGNGRTGRLMHYLIQYGTERGARAFEEETYAILAKLPIYDTDGRKAAINDTPPPDMANELPGIAKKNFPDYDKYSPRDQAVLKAKYFLQIMSGKESHIIQGDAKVRDDSMDRESAGMEIIPGGTMDARDFYRLSYHRYSQIPNRDSNVTPEGARVMGEKPTKEQEEMMRNIHNLTRALTSEVLEV